MALMQITILKDFAYFHGGCNRADYVAGETVDATDDEMIEVATREGWAQVPTEKATKPPANKARKAAPENK